jgi:hypothetical protein
VGQAHSGLPAQLFSGVTEAKNKGQLHREGAESAKKGKKPPAFREISRVFSFVFLRGLRAFAAIFLLWLLIF